MHYLMHIIGKRTTGRYRVRLITLLCLLLSAGANAGVPTISNQRVTDVATRSFSVIMTVNEPSTLSLSLFAADCATPSSGFTTALQQNTTSGNLRITVSGLSTATNYCYQLAVTSVSTSDVSTTSVLPVVTASAIERTVLSGSDIIPVGNDILKVPTVHIASGESRDAILTTFELADSTGAAPLSLMLSLMANSDYFNLNNLFTSETGKTKIVSGGERVKITEIHGSNGCAIQHFRKLPPASGGTLPRSFVQADGNDIDASGGVNILDTLRVVGGKGTTTSGPCFNNDLDLNSDGIIDSADLSIIKGGFNGLP